MTTDSERREVARRLRKTRVERYSSILNGIHLGEIVGVGAQIVSPHEDQVRAAAHRLADLIEPETERTCRVESSREYENDGCYSWFKYELSCGHEVKSECQLPPSYCPECGKKVLYDIGKYL